MSGPRKTNKAPGDSGAPEVEETQAAAAPPPPPPVAPPPAAPPPAAPPTAAPAPAAPPPPVAAAPEASVPPAQPAAAAPPPAAPAAPAGPPAGAQVAAAITGVATTLKERLSGPELLLGGGALLIAIVSFLIFEFLLGTSGPTEAAVIISALLLGFIGLERTQTQGFGSWYKVVLVLFGAILAMGAIYSLLVTIRHGSGLDFGDWLALIAWWVGGALAGAGSWASYKVKA
jgi:hypothetical protein